jgi:hypothetical protein
MFHKSTYRSFGVTVLVLLASSSIGAMVNAHRTTYITFAQSVQLPGVALPAGTYIFEVVNPFTSADVVAVRSRDRSKLLLLRTTTRIERPRTRSMKSLIVLGEVPSGKPSMVKAWFPEGETRGHAFHN